jgi:hypothetical protein
MAVKKKASSGPAARKPASRKPAARKMGAGPSAATKAKATASPSSLIDGRIGELGDWRGETLARLRRLIHEAVPGVVEEWKWRGVPVWEHDGIICTGETYKDYVKTTFARGASIPDPKKLFNSSLEGGTRRAIDFRKDDRIDEKAFKALVGAAAALNAAKRKQVKRAGRQVR